VVAVRVDQAGEDELALRIERLVGLHIEAGSDRRDAPPFDQHVAGEVADRRVHRDHRAAADEQPALRHGSGPGPPGNRDVVGERVGRTGGPGVRSCVATFLEHGSRVRRRKI
jgi:hypothetical protein